MTRSRWLIPGIVLGAAIVALWFVRPAPTLEPDRRESIQALEPGGHGDVLERASADPRDAESRSVEGPSSAEKAPTALNSRLRVHSEAGLPLAFVEVEPADSPWRKMPLERGACDLAGIERPLRLRAPGHLPVTITAGDREIVLTPDALFTIESPGLRDCVDSIAAFPAWLGRWDSDPQNAEIAGRIAAVSTWDFVSADRWAIAVSARRLAGVLPHSVVDVAFVRADRQRTWVDFDVTPGARGIWNPSCEGQAGVADLEVRVVRPEGEARGELELHVWLVREGSPDAVTQAHPWGGAVRVSDVFLDTRVAADEDRATIERLPVDRRFSLTVRDAVSSAYGRIVFDHDGSPREVRLLEGLEITGRLLASDGSAPPRRARFAWNHLGPGEDDWSWHGEVSLLDLTEDGRFHLRSPTRVPPKEDVDLDLPRGIELTVLAPGFEELERRFDTAGGHQLDCGDLVVVPLRPAIVLAPGHGVQESGADWMDLRLADRPDLSWRIGQCRRRQDGSLAVFLIEAGQDVEGRTLSKVIAAGSAADREIVFPVEPSDLLSVHVLSPEGDVGRAFRRGSGGLYEAIREQHTLLDVECHALPSNGKRWTLGWQWNGLWDLCGSLGPESLGEHTWLSISAPADGAQLWWSSGSLPPSMDPVHAAESGSVPFQVPPWKLDLP